MVDREEGRKATATLHCGITLAWMHIAWRAFDQQIDTGTGVLIGCGIAATAAWANRGRGNSEAIGAAEEWTAAISEATIGALAATVGTIKGSSGISYTAGAAGVALIAAGAAARWWTRIKGAADRKLAGLREKS